MKRFLVLSKKRYVYQQSDDTIVTKGFQKKVNGLVKYMSEFILSHVWRALFGVEDTLPSRGMDIVGQRVITGELHVSRFYQILHLSKN